ncbi:MAG: bifunctional ornithine acetyltransferase/N-acetylglutamate synthase, partial [Deltaproteobacteria bacterium]
DAITAARTIANSALVKTAFYGSDPNWGRIMAALGRSGIRMREQVVAIWVDDVQIVEKGMGRGAEFEAQAAARMKSKEFSLTVDLHEGQFEDHITTCDLTHEYVTINADYRT